MRGQRIYIPGWTNKWLQAISTLVPTLSKVKYVAARWTRSQTDLAGHRLLEQKRGTVEKGLQGETV